MTQFNTEFCGQKLTKITPLLGTKTKDKAFNFVTPTENY